MLLLSPFLLLGTLLVLHAASEDAEMKAAVVNDEFEVDYETAASLAGLAIECHDQVLMMFLKPLLSKQQLTAFAEERAIGFVNFASESRNSF